MKTFTEFTEQPLDEAIYDNAQGSDSPFDRIALDNIREAENELKIAMRNVSDAVEQLQTAKAQAAVCDRHVKQLKAQFRIK